MPMSRIPQFVTRDQLLTAAIHLGINPTDVPVILLTPEMVVVTQFRRDASGSLIMDGGEYATDTHTIPVTGREGGWPGSAERSASETCS